MGKVSVIMPVYNGEKTIRKAVASLLLQSYEDWELVIVNDGSTDRTKDIIDSLCDNRIKVVHLKKNMGRGYARGIALEHVSGEYLAYLDADDMMHKEKLMSEVEVLENDKKIMLVFHLQSKKWYEM